jgi:hypothetical protein
VALTTELVAQYGNIKCTQRPPLRGSLGPVLQDHWEDGSWTSAIPPTFCYSKDSASIATAAAVCTDSTRLAWPNQFHSAGAGSPCSVSCSRHGELVPKDEIMQVVWRGRVVEEANLNVQIAKLRHILDQNREHGSCIQTISGHGYRCRTGDAR